MKLKKAKKTLLSQGSKYVNIAVSILLYMLLTAALREVTMEERVINMMGITIDAAPLRGILTQLQMVISVYLVLSANKAGYIVSMMLNLQRTIFSIRLMGRIQSTTPLPGIISYVAVMLILTLIITYKRRMTNYLTQMITQEQTLAESERSLYKMAFYDPLTDLPNKDLFINELERDIALAKQSGSLLAVMFIDLDSFKSVNDTMGHSAGDAVLKIVAKRLKESLRKEDLVARFAGDEFLVKISNVEKVEEIYDISKKILAMFQQRVKVQNTEFSITISGGVAIYPVDGKRPQTLIKNADIAMYYAKREGKNQFVYCSKEMKEEVITKLKVKNNLYKALENNELFLLYQPQVRVETQEIIGFEALLRWNNAEYGIILPDIFIPLAEITGMIIPIGLWVFKSACEQYQKHRQICQKDYRISINVSLEQLKDSNFIRDISDILKSTNTEGSHIQIQITEGIAFNEEAYILERIQDVKNLGITISIDDFGAGYSSFGRLRTLPIDLIKIDKEFVQGISENAKKEKEIVKSIIRLAKNLGIGVLAEGVEKKEEYNFLRDEECDEIQGFYFYEPMMPEEIVKVINQQKTINHKDSIHIVSEKKER